MTNLAIDPFDEGPKQHVDIHAEGGIERRVARKLGTCTRLAALAIHSIISNPPRRRNCGLKKSGNRL